MDIYTPGGPVALTFPLRNEAGDILEPSSLRWRVLDEDELVVMDWTPPASLAIVQDEYSVTIDASYTTLAAGSVRGIRLVELELTTPAGIHVLSQEFLLQSGSILTVGENSFCSYMRALMVAEDFTEQSMSGWQRETRRVERERALIEAYRAIMRLPLFSSRSGGVTLSSAMATGGVAGLDSDLRQALFQAQVMEANEVLNADPVAIARRNGLLSMTVGESSQYFGSSKPLECPVMSRQALKALGPWVSYSVKIGRA